MRSIEVEVSGTLELRYMLEGELDRIRIPLQGVSRRADGLWKHTCFEAFLRAASGYREFNFSPSMEWAGYDFSGYREGMAPIDKEWAPRIGIHRKHRRFELSATLCAAAPMRLALAAVIEEENGAVSYWALTHPVSRPDFHHPDSFILEL